MPRSFLKPPEGYPPRVCSGCNTSYTPRRHDQKHCTKACKEAMNNFEKARSQQIYRALYHWQVNGGRMGKGPEGASLGDITRMIRGWIAQDKAEGRAVPPLPFTNR